MPESAHVHPIATYLDALDQQASHCDDVVAKAFKEHVEPDFLFGNEIYFFNRDIARLHASALAAVAASTSVRAVQDHLTEVLNNLRLMHIKFLEDKAAAVQDYPDPAKYLHTCISIIHHSDFVADARHLLDALRNHSVPTVIGGGTTSDSQQANALRAADDASPEIHPFFMTAPDLAKRIGSPPKEVDTFLRRFAKANGDARTRVNLPRKGEPRFIYRTDIVWPALVAWKKKRKTMAD
jgi:hypothetical protein